MSVRGSVRTTKSERLELRLSVQELELLKERAGALGLSVSGFVRKAALGKVELPSVPMGSRGVPGGWVPPSQQRERQTRAHRDLGPKGDTIPAPRAVASSKPFGCPVCNFRTDNIKASCPTHKRTVIGA